MATEVGVLLVGLVVVAITVVDEAGQKANTKTRGEQETPPRGTEKSDNPLHVC